MPVKFEVLGTPVGKSRPKFSTVNGQAVAYTPTKTANYETLVKLAYQQQCGGKVYDKDVQLRAEIMAHFSAITQQGKRELGKKPEQATGQRKDQKRSPASPTQWQRSGATTLPGTPTDSYHFLRRETSEKRTITESPEGD